MHTIIIITLCLFSTVPTFAMRGRLMPLRLMHRGYATMAQEDFNKLLDSQMPSTTFVSDLAALKKDTDDLHTLRKELSHMIIKIEREPSYERDFFLLVALGTAVNFISFPAGCPALFAGYYFYWKDLSQTKNLKRNKAKLLHLESLIEEQKEKDKHALYNNL
jgi:hypothetical protein